VTLTDGWRQPNAPAIPEEVKKSAEELLARSKTVEDRFVAPAGGRGGEERERLRQLAEAQDAAAQLQKDVAELNKLAEEVPKLNKMMSDAGRAYFNLRN
jgi:hypothetical protein